MGRRRTHPHLLRTDADPGAFAELIRAVERDAVGPSRVGWLDWHPDEPADDGTGDEPTRLGAAADRGAHRAVRVDAAGSVAVSRRRGPAVLADVLRVHFAGCRLVLVRGEVDAPEIRAGDDGRYDVVDDDGVRTFDAAELAERLRRPRPFR